MSGKWIYVVVNSYHDVGVHNTNVTLFPDEEAALRFYDVIVENEKAIFGGDAFTEQGNLREGYTLETGNYNMRYWCLKNNATGEFSEVKIVPTQIRQHF